MKKSNIGLLLCGMPMLFYADNAHAWGLYTHVYFSQMMLFSLPLFSTFKILGAHMAQSNAQTQDGPPEQNPDEIAQKVVAAIKQHPQLFLAGACLPDLAVLSSQFKLSHQWQVSKRMLQHARSAEELAIAAGFTSHLYVDVIAHNHFVPAHEGKWCHQGILTHIAAEWAMDAYVGKQLLMRPQELIGAHIPILSRFVSRHFNVGQALATRQLKRLAWLDRLLRVSRLCEILLWGLCRKDADFRNHLDYYLAYTQSTLDNFMVTLQGTQPCWQPELTHLNAAELALWREKCLQELRLRLHLPIEHFSQLNRLASAKLA